MVEYTFSRAAQEDEQDLRFLLANSPMPGRITVAFEREPDYFMGCATMGRDYDVLIARHHSTNELAAVFCRAVRQVYINGRQEAIGYLGQLRVQEKHRGRWLLSLGLPHLKALHEDGRVSVYLSAVSDENRLRDFLARSRSGYPDFCEVARVFTLGLILRRMRKPDSAGFEIVPGSLDNLDEIIYFLQQNGAEKQFFPVYQRRDFIEGSLTTIGFDVKDFIIARKQNKIMGVMGLWDQSICKQSVVRGYHGVLGRLRPVYNIWAALWGAQPLPEIGEHLRSAYGSFICVLEDDPGVFRVLLEHTMYKAFIAGFAYLMVGFCDGDPLLKVANKYLHISYYSRLYTAAWADGRAMQMGLDQRVPYIEIASL